MEARGLYAALFVSPQLPDGGSTLAEIEKLIAQLDELIDQYKAGRDSSSPGGGSPPSFALLVHRLEAAIDRIAAPGSTYVKQLDLYRNIKTPRNKIYAVYTIATGLRDDLKAGWVTSFIELVHADTYSDYLDMAVDLLDAGYKDPAAVITGTSLEVHVRALCVKHGVDTETAPGKPKKADTMNADLKKEGIYDGLQQKQITAWMDLRNKAAHGDYGDYDKSQVRLFIDGVRAFMLKHPA
ncbi:hypothetical protein [Streptomyces sp. NPDC001601]|uniref:hypothetical protein n=1 Tax=Streptomyces sp. NPDC001601 TaxID=3364592 RepID=UPI0036833981